MNQPIALARWGRLLAALASPLLLVTVPGAETKSDRCSALFSPIAQIACVRATDSVIRISLLGEDGCPESIRTSSVQEHALNILRKDRDTFTDLVQATAKARTTSSPELRGEPLVESVVNDVFENASVRRSLESAWQGAPEAERTAVRACLSAAPPGPRTLDAVVNYAVAYVWPTRIGRFPFEVKLHICTGDNGLFRISAPDIDLMRIARTAIFGNAEVLAYIAPALEAVVMSPRYSMLSSDADRLEHVRLELAAELRKSVGFRCAIARAALREGKPLEGSESICPDVGGAQ